MLFRSAWLEGRGPKMDLLGAIDDATGKVVYAHFRPSEDQVGYLLMLRTVALTHGLPHILYHDRHTILRSPKQATIEDELAGRQPQSQIQRIMEELGITSIPALSPQAKGRIERLWLDENRRFVNGVPIFWGRIDGKPAVQRFAFSSLRKQIGRAHV